MVKKDIKIKNKKNLFLMCLVIFIFFVLSRTHVYAATDATYKPIYTLAEYNLDSIGDIGFDLIRRVLWGGVRLCAYFVDGFYSGLGQVFKLMTFSTSDELTSLAIKYKVLYKPLLIVTIVGIGLWLILNNKAANQLNISTSLMLMLVIVLGMPVITEKLTNLTEATSEYAMAQWAGGAKQDKAIESVSSSIVCNQIVDLNVLDESMDSNGEMARFTAQGNGSNNFKLGTDEWKYIDITQGMGDSSNNKLKNQKVWDNKIGIEVNGLNCEFVPQKLERGLVFNEYYYRFQIRNWLILYGELIATIIILGLSIVRLVMLIIEISIAQIYMPLIAVTDLATGQRMKEALKGFIALFASIFLIYAILGVYFTGIIYINGLDISIFLKFLVICAWAISLVKGSDIIERITGVDLGFKSSSWALAGTYFASKTALKLGQSLYDMGKLTKDRLFNNDSKLNTMDELNKDNTHDVKSNKGDINNGIDGNSKNDNKINGKDIDINENKPSNNDNNPNSNNENFNGTQKAAKTLDNNINNKNIDDKNLNDKNLNDKNLNDKNLNDRNLNDRNLNDRNLNSKDNKNINTENKDRKPDTNL